MDKLPEKENRQEKVLDRIFLEEILGTLEAKERRLILLGALSKYKNVLFHKKEAV